jgi:predicted secreted protein
MPGTRAGQPYVIARLYRKLLSELAKMLTKTDFSQTKRFTTVLCLLLTVSGVAPARAQTESQTSQTVSLRPGVSTTIVLRENPSTGFRWRLEMARSTNLSIIRVIDRGYRAGQIGLIGAPGSHHWEVKARAPGVASVAFIYVRPWERKPPAETHFVQVNVSRR